MRPLRIVADRHIWQVEDAFSSLPDYCVALEVVEAGDIQASILQHTDVLLVRSSTQVDASLLADSSVRFVATATVGEDHIDLPYLAQQGIAFASAAGSSTGSVIEYMMTALLQLQAMNHVSLAKHRLGVIGVGRIGGQLVNVCQRLGINVLSNDPPRASRENNASLLSLDAMLQQADVLTLHTPLVRSGKYNTHHLIDAHTLAKFRGFGIINAGRGACVDNDALLNWLNQDQQHWAVLDCWENEPNPNPLLLRHPRMLIATPHIAGHSLDGKANNTQYIYKALCDFLHCPPIWTMRDALPTARAPLTLPLLANPWDALHYITNHDYPIMRDHQAICQRKNTLPSDAFRHYRRHYPVRRAWLFCRWLINDEYTQLWAKNLGYPL